MSQICYFLNVAYFVLGLPKPYFFKHPNLASTALKSAPTCPAVFLKIIKETNSIQGAVPHNEVLVHSSRGLLWGHGLESWKCVESRKCISSFFVP